MIKSFKSKETEKIWEGEASKKLPLNIQRVAKRKLRMLNNSVTLNDLRTPPSNFLKKLKGSLKDKYSIRVNDQWRICFDWHNGDTVNVEITDYH